MLNEVPMLKMRSGSSRPLSPASRNVSRASVDSSRCPWRHGNLNHERENLRRRDN